jgi:hypothetical protein
MSAQPEIDPPPGSMAWIVDQDCPHRELRSIKYVLANGLWQHRRQCLDCGKLLAGSLPHKTLPPDADVLLATEEQKRQEAIWGIEVAQREAARVASRQEWFREHDEYLLTSEWRLKRKAVLDRCGYICEGCGMQRAVQVHHLTYKHWKKEFLFELVGLCAGCHERVHED